MDVRKLFAYDSNNGNKYSDGIAFNLNQSLDSLTKLEGTYNSVIKLTNKQLSSINSDLIQWNDRIKLIEDGLRSKFQSMETLMSQLKAQSSSLTQSLSQLSNKQ
jgi:flagellar capping protein FliD